MKNKLLTIVLISLWASEILASNGDKIQTQLEAPSNTLLKVIPTLPVPISADSKVSFKISNIGFVKIPSAIFQVNFTDPDNKLIWKRVKSLTNLTPAREITLKFPLSLKKIKFGMYELRYTLIYADKEIEHKIEVPVAISVKLTFDQPAYKINESITMNLELIKERISFDKADLIATITIPDVQFSAQKPVSLYPNGKIEIPYSLNIPTNTSLGTHTVTVDLKSSKSDKFISKSFDFVITQLKPGEEDYTIGVLDVLDIFVVEDPDLRKTFPVTPDGKIFFPIVGNISVVGMSPSQVSEEIASILSKDGYLVNPHVTVSVLQIGSKKFSVLGEVERPGVFPINEGIDLLKAVSLAGGFTKFADLHKVKIFREDKIIIINVDKIIKKGEIGKNITIQPGDIIIVQESLF